MNRFNLIDGIIVFQKDPILLQSVLDDIKGNPCPECSSTNTGLLEELSCLKIIDTYRCFDCECVFEVHEKLVMEGDRVVRKEYSAIN